MDLIIRNIKCAHFQILSLRSYIFISTFLSLLTILLCTLFRYFMFNVGETLLSVQGCNQYSGKYATRTNSSLLLPFMEIELRIKMKIHTGSVERYECCRSLGVLQWLTYVRPARTLLHVFERNKRVLVRSRRT